MHPIVAAAALVAAAIHVWFFVLESILFMQPRVFRRFGLASEDEARVVRSFAYNQGFYNLFLAAGAIGGVAKSLTGDPEGGVPVLLFACGSMVAAGIVLVTHNRGFARAAAVQVIPPLVAIAGFLLLR